MNTFATIANCFDLGQAQQLKTLLESEGIEAFIPDEFSAGVAPHHFNSPAGVRLQVAAVDEAKARELVKDFAA